MSYQTRFMAWIQRSGLSSTAVIYTTTGTACPCMSFNNRAAYSAEWHRLYPSSAACNGTGVISSTTSQTHVKCILVIASMFRDQPGLKEFLSVIGEIQQTDLFMYGCVNEQTGEQVSLSSTDEYTTYVTYDSNDYTVRDVFTLAGSAGQIARLTRRN